MHDYMRFTDVHPDFILCSLAVRTRQTLGAVLPALGEDIAVDVRPWALPWTVRPP